jgi:tetratricopeptide (TPR) repeat protein
MRLRAPSATPVAPPTPALLSEPRAPHPSATPPKEPDQASRPVRPRVPLPGKRIAVSPRPQSPARKDEPPRSRALSPALEDSLERANRLRAERRWREAADAYAAVMVDGDPRSVSVAALARATLLLERLNRPREALVLFRRALTLAPTGPLSDEALYGIAASFRALGNEAEERGALERLLADHPSTPLRRRAEDRLSELRAR